MKILHVIHGLAHGGLENGVVNLLNRLPYPEFDQAVCCLDQGGEMADRIDRHVPIFVIGRRRHDLTTPWRLARLLRDLKPDVVHCRNWNTWPDAVVGNLLACGRRSLVWSFHGFAGGDSFPVRRRVASWVLASLTDHLFAVCSDSANRYAQKAGIRPSQFEVLYNGVQTERYLPVADRAPLRAELGLAPHEAVVVTVANLTPVKDHASLIAAAAKLCARNVPSLRFVCIGEGPQRPHLERQLQALGLADRFCLLGKSNRVPDYLAAADLFVLPSRLEGMSNAILEAMACGLPVVARRVGGNPELVNHGETGLLCDPDDTDALADAIGCLLDDANLRARMGACGRQRAVSHFSLDAMVSAYSGFYRRVVQGIE